MTRGKIGDKIGYSVMQLRGRHWVETHCPTLDTITQAEGMLRQYQHADPAITFAIARLELVMISRPDVSP